MSCSNNGKFFESRCPFWTSWPLRCGQHAVQKRRQICSLKAWHLARKGTAFATLTLNRRYIQILFKPMTLKEMKFDLRFIKLRVIFDKYGRIVRQFQSKPQKPRAIKIRLGVKQTERWTHHHYSLIIVHSVQKLHKTLYCQCLQLHNLTCTDLSYCPSHLFQR
jgi:hypothetical protein